MGLFGSGKKDKGTAASAEPVDVTLEDGRQITVTRRIDCLGHSCPRPQLMTKKAVDGVDSSQVVEVLVDNPTSMEALPPMCPSLQATHLGTVADTKGWRVYIQKN